MTTDRFWSKVRPADAMDCWEWTATRNVGGYGAFSVGGQRRPAHRVAYEMLVAPIPEGLDLDHLCRNRACVNPWHLEPVTRRVNSLRGQSPTIISHLTGVCAKGHQDYVEMPSGRRCRACLQENRDKHRAEKNARRRARRAAQPKVAREAPTHCFRGHEWTSENTRTLVTGVRSCRACARLKKAERRRAESATSGTERGARAIHDAHQERS